MHGQVPWKTNPGDLAGPPMRIPTMIQGTQGFSIAYICLARSATRASGKGPGKVHVAIGGRFRCGTGGKRLRFRCGEGRRVVLRWRRDGLKTGHGKSKCPPVRGRFPCWGPRPRERARAVMPTAPYRDSAAQLFPFLFLDRTIDA